MLIPLVIVIQMAMPGTLGTFKAIIKPSYVIQEQSRDVGTGSGRIADLGPSLSEWSRDALPRAGLRDPRGHHRPRSGRRGLRRHRVASARRSSTTSGSARCSRSVPWASLALLWLFFRPIRRLAPQARSDPGPDGWLMTALAASLTSYAVGMLTFDAFAFIQVTFLAFIMFGFRPWS